MGWTSICFRLPALAWLGAALVLSGCGFKLRGEVEVPPELNPMYIQAGGGSPVAQALRDRLRGTQVRLAASPKDAKLVLRILGEARSSRVVAVNRAGKVLSFELYYRVSFDVQGADGKERLPRQEIDLVRGFDNPDTEVLGKQLEGELIYQDLIDDAADRVLIRLRAALIKR
jgi:LPS-assembly lipoprotein